MRQISKYNIPHEILNITFNSNYQFKVKISTDVKPNYYVPFLLDTGACLNLIRINILKKIGYSNINYQNRATIMGLGNVKVDTIGSVLVNLKIGSSLFETEFYILHNLPFPGIIGANFLKTNTLLVDEQFKYIVLKVPENNEIDLETLDNEISFKNKLSLSNNQKKVYHYSLNNNKWNFECEPIQQSPDNCFGPIDYDFEDKPFKHIQLLCQSKNVNDPAKSNIFENNNTLHEDVFYDCEETYEYIKEKQQELDLDTDKDCDVVEYKKKT